MILQRSKVLSRTPAKSEEWNSLVVNSHTRVSFEQFELRICSSVVEPSIFNRQVEGSNPSRFTIVNVDVAERLRGRLQICYTLVRIQSSTPKFSAIVQWQNSALISHMSQVQILLALPSYAPMVQWLGRRIFTPEDAGFDPRWVYQNYCFCSSTGRATRYERVGQGFESLQELQCGCGDAGAHAWLKPKR